MTVELILVTDLWKWLLNILQQYGQYGSKIKSW